MYISRLEISGVKGFSGPRSVDLDFTRPDGTHAGWTVLAGRNGSGKTSLLRTAVTAMGLGPEEAAGWSTGEDGHVRMVLSIDYDEFLELVVAHNPDDPRSQQFFLESASLTDIEIALSYEWRRSDKVRRSNRARVREEHVLRGTGAAGPVRMEIEGGWDWFGWILDELESVVAVGAFRRLGGHAGGWLTEPTAAVASLYDENVDLAAGVSWLMDLHHRSVTGDEAAGGLLSAALTLLGDGLLPDGVQVVAVDADGLWVERDGARHALRELSDGYRAAAALASHILWTLATHPYPRDLVLGTRDGRPVVPLAGIVLIDEVDAHLHVTWQQRIGYWLKAHFPDVQFIVTTHSPYICQAADPGGLIRLGSPGDDTAPEVVSEELYQRVVYGSGDDAILSELFGLESPYSVAAENARRRIGDLEGRVLQGDASASELAEYEALSLKLNSSLAARVDEVAARLARSD